MYCSKNASLSLAGKVICTVCRVSSIPFHPETAGLLTGLIPCIGENANVPCYDSSFSFGPSLPQHENSAFDEIPDVHIFPDVRRPKYYQILFSTSLASVYNSGSCTCKDSFLASKNSFLVSFSSTLRRARRCSPLSLLEDSKRGSRIDTRLLVSREIDELRACHIRQPSHC